MSKQQAETKVNRYKDWPIGVSCIPSEAHAGCFNVNLHGDEHCTTDSVQIGFGESENDALKSAIGMLEAAIKSMRNGVQEKCDHKNKSTHFTGCGEYETYCDDCGKEF